MRGLMKRTVWFLSALAMLLIACGAFAFPRTVLIEDFTNWG